MLAKKVSALWRGMSDDQKALWARDNVMAAPDSKSSKQSKLTDPARKSKKVISSDFLMKVANHINGQTTPTPAKQVKVAQSPVRLKSNP